MYVRKVQAFVNVVSVFMLSLSNFLDVVEASDVFSQCLDFLFEFCNLCVCHYFISSQLIIIEGLKILRKDCDLGYSALTLPLFVRGGSADSAVRMRG